MPNKTQLTREQLSLLETLTYLDDEEPFKRLAKASKGQTIGSFLASFDGVIQDDKMYHSFISGKDWKRVITRVLNDKTLSNMKIQATNTSLLENVGGEACLFTGNDGDAVFAYRGTSPLEWEDNVMGAAANKVKATDPETGEEIETDAIEVDTPCQRAALKWYQDTLKSENLKDCNKIVVGHSKGGNKAKYITIMDDSVDKCVSFDGQGFSDEFIDVYENRIQNVGHKIENHNIDNDFVNILLNEVGATTKYYQGFDVGEFKRNHCPHVFYEDTSKEAHMEEALAGRNEGLTLAHDILNSFCRSLTPDAKRETIDTLGGALGSLMRKVEDNKKEAVLHPDVIEEVRGMKYRFGAANLGMTDKKVEAVFEKIAAEKEKAEKVRRKAMTSAERKAEDEAKENAEYEKSPVTAFCRTLLGKKNEADTIKDDKFAKNAENLSRLFVHAKKFVHANENNEKRFESSVRNALGGGFWAGVAGKVAKFALRHPGFTQGALHFVNFFTKSLKKDQLTAIDGIFDKYIELNDADDKKTKEETKMLRKIDKDYQPDGHGIDPGLNKPLKYKAIEAKVEVNRELVSVNDIEDKKPVKTVKHENSTQHENDMDMSQNNAQEMKGWK